MAGVHRPRELILANPVLRDGSEVGAWVFKANPAVWDVGSHLASGVEVDEWRMTPSYRIELMAPGHPCALWVTRDSAVVGSPGIFAVGELVSLPYLDAGDPSDTLWRDRGARDQVRPYIGTAMSILDEPIGADELRDDPACARAEIFRAPRMGSPLAFDPVAWSAVVARR